TERLRRWFATGLAAAAMLFTLSSLVAGIFYVRQREHAAELNRVADVSAAGADSALKECQRLKAKMMNAATPLEGLLPLAEERISHARKAVELSALAPNAINLQAQCKATLNDAEAEPDLLRKDLVLLRDLLDRCYAPLDINAAMADVQGKG